MQGRRDRFASGKAIGARAGDRRRRGAYTDYLPAELVERLCSGDHPVRVWRRHRGLTREELARLAAVAPSYVTEIETGKKPGSFAALTKLAAVLRISLDDIAAWTTAGR